MHARHILIRTTEIRSDEEAAALARELRAKILAGEDFASLAQQHSNDPGSALSGGDLGWAQAGAFDPEFEAALAALPVDGTSEVIRTQHGYHVAQVLGRRVQDFSEEYKRNQAANFLRNRKFEEELETWLREIRSKAFVEIRI
jgi:peptidyl-prolyl cis-trans isomerase SurA